MSEIKVTFTIWHILAKIGIYSYSKPGLQAANLLGDHCSKYNNMF